MRQTELVADLERLVAFPTVSDRPVTELAAWLGRRCADLGFRVERFEAAEPGKCSLICAAGPEDEGGLVLSGHMDVVPTEGQPWSTDPFRVSERDGRLYGRGTADMKGFFAATLQALGRIDLSTLRRPLRLVWTHDEEIGCAGSAELADHLVERGHTLPVACLIGEPTDFRILRMHPGHVAVELEVHGVAAHSSRPDLGTNAIAGAAEVIARVEALAEELAAERAELPELERPWVAVNVARISGGRAVNIVPDRCVIELGYRPLPGTEPEAVFERLRGAIAELDVEVEARILRLTPSMLTPRGTALEALLAPLASATAPGAASFATDGGNLARLGLRPLVFGPGSIEVAHKADEYIETDALVRAATAIERVVRAACVAPLEGAPGARG